MEQTVYVDLLFLINFSMDFLGLYIAAKILSVRLSRVRLVLASVIGGIYSVVALFMPSGYFFSLILDLAVSFVMSVVAHLKRRGDGIFLFWISYFASSMALGGFMSAIFTLLNRSGLGELQAETGDGISVWLFALIAIASGLITLMGGRFFRKKASVREAKVILYFNGKKIVLSALVDSGNLLCEPLSGRSCIVTDRSALRALLPPEFYSGSLSSLPPELAKLVRLVPATSAVGDRMLVAVRMDKIEIDSGRGSYEVDALVALTDIDADIKVLVPSVLIK